MRDMGSDTIYCNYLFLLIYFGEEMPAQRPLPRALLFGAAKIAEAATTSR
jgi:hypothetical protein